MKTTSTHPVRGRAKTVLLLVDVINTFDFPEARQLLRFALPAAEKIAALKARSRKRGIPAIYINDNFGKWRSDFKRQVEHCISEECLGAEIARQLIPHEDDYFVLKPKHSGFYSTSLDVLLHYLGVKRLIIVGFATDICILFTANDAYMRDYEVVIPSDCVAAESASANQRILKHMERFLKADIRNSSRLRI